MKASSGNLHPEVWKAEDDRGPYVIKTFRASNGLFRRTLCRFITRREERNLSLLDGLKGVPKSYGCPEPWTLEMQFLDAVPVKETKEGHGLDHAFFDELWALLEAIHQRGLNYGDLRRKNMMRDRVTGAPMLVDFAQSFRHSSNLFPFKQFREMAYNTDRHKFLKIKKWYLDLRNVTKEEREEYFNPPIYLTFGRFLRQKLYRPFKERKRSK